MPLIYALIITIVVEGLAMFVLTRSMKWVRFNLYCNMVTNPLLNLGLYALIYFGRRNWYDAATVIGEVLVLVSEAVLYRLMTSEKYSRCFIRSFITNALSLALGSIFFGIIY